MPPVPPPQLLSCHLARGFDLARCGLILDYRGDQPPVVLFEALQAAGWSTPAPAAPPAGAIDWSRPDRATGRRWSTLPFLVVGAMAVPGPSTAPAQMGREWIRETLDGLGLTLEADEIHVGTLRDTEPGLAEVLRASTGEVVARDLERRAHMADVFASTPSIASPIPVVNRPVLPPAPARAPQPTAARRPAATPQPAVAAAPVPPPRRSPAVVDVREPVPAIDLTSTGAASDSTVVALRGFRSAKSATRPSGGPAAPSSTGAATDQANAPLQWCPPIASNH